MTEVDFHLVGCAFFVNQGVDMQPLHKKGLWQVNALLLNKLGGWHNLAPGTAGKIGDYALHFVDFIVI